MTDPATLADYEAAYARAQSITGFGVDVVTHFPCPACAAPGWLDFPITAALDGYAGVQDPTTCAACGRTFRLVITIEDGGAAAGGTTSMTVVQTGGADPPGYLPPMRREPAP